MVVSMIGLHSVLCQKDLPLEGLSEQKTLAFYGPPLVPDSGAFRDLDAAMALESRIFPLGSPIFFASRGRPPVVEPKATTAQFRQNSVN